MTAVEWWRRARDQWTADPPARRSRDVAAWNELSNEDRIRIRARIKDGLRDPDPAVRELAARLRDDVVLAEMDTRPLSPHAALEIATTAWTGRPLEPGAPVPGCSCPACTGIAADAPVRLKPNRKRKPSGTPLDLDAARAVPVSVVARMLGLELDASGKRARCPFHDDTHPSMDIRDDKGRAFCSPCGKSWDGIALVREVRGCTLPNALEYLERLNGGGKHEDAELAGAHR